MPNILLELLAGLLVLGIGYYVITSTRSSGAKKKKRKSKKSKKDAAAGPTVVEVTEKKKVQQAASKVLPSKPADGQSGQATTKQQPKQSRQPTPVDAESDPDFPSLSSPPANGHAASAKKKNVNKTLAERLAMPIPKTSVDDMLDPDVVAPRKIAQNMRIVKPAPAAPLILNKVESDDGWERPSEPAEEAWQSVKPSNKKPNVIRLTSSSSAAASTAAPPSIPGLTEQSKKQRQNAARVQAAKAAREAEEHDRLARLAAHKRTLENERMKEQERQRQKDKSRQPVSQQRTSTNREKLSGGQTAKVVDGALIWD